MPPTLGRSDDDAVPSDEEPLQRTLALVLDLQAQVHDLLELVTGEAVTRQRGLGALIRDPDDTTPSDEGSGPSRSRALGQLAGDGPPVDPRPEP